MNQRCYSLMSLRFSWLLLVYLNGLQGEEHNHLIYSQFSFFGFTGLFLSLVLFVCSLVMSQSLLLGKNGVAASKGAGNSKLKIKIPHFDNSALIAGYSKTVIGRCMNPRKQDMKTLLFMFPRIWQLEGRVVGADLGQGRFQFDFENEEDLVEILQMEPFHFDYWMVSMVRWQPYVDPSYPSLLPFWIRVIGVPLQYWADPTFRGIGEALGSVKAVDLDGGRVQVIVNGFQPLNFEMIVEFAGGEEITISLRYERHFGFCRVCHSLCHDAVHYPPSGVVQGDSPDLPPDNGDGRNALSYKTAAVQEKVNATFAEGKQGSGSKGKGLMRSYADEDKKYFKGQGNGGFRGRSERLLGEGSTRSRRFTSYAQALNNRFMRADQRGEPILDDAVVTERVEVKTLVEETEQHGSKAKKALLFETETHQALEGEGMFSAQDNGLGNGLDNEVMGTVTDQEENLLVPEEVAMIESAGEVDVVPVESDLFINEETCESFILLLAEVEASLPLVVNPIVDADSVEHFLAVHMEGNSSVGGDHLAELSLMDGDFLEPEDVEEYVVKEVNVMIDQGRGKGKDHVLGKKQSSKGVH